MGSDAGWKLEGPRENITITTKVFKKSFSVLKKCEGGPFIGGPAIAIFQRLYRLSKRKMYVNLV